MLISDGLVVLLGSYLGWTGGALAVLYADMSHRPPEAGEWGIVQWTGVCALAGGLALPFYYWATRNTGAGLVKGIFLGIAVAVVAFSIRLGLSLLLGVPLA
jgi:hypothetical protein